MKYLSGLACSLCVCFFTAAQTLPIVAIQGTGLESPYKGQTVTTTGAVTYVFGNTYYIQSVNSGEPGYCEGCVSVSGSRGLQVLDFTGTPPSMGAVVQITGAIDENSGTTRIIPSQRTQIDAIAILPKPVALSDTFPGKTPSLIPQLERVEGMHVLLQGTVLSPSEGSLFYAVAGSDIPFREPGLPFPGRTGLPVFDNNPEKFLVRATGLGLGAAPNVRAGQTFQGYGVMVQENNNYVFYPFSILFGELPQPTPVNPTPKHALSLGSINVELFTNRNGTFYDQRLTKFVSYVRDMFQFPDIIALQEVANNTVVSQMAGRLSNENPGAPSYVPLMRATSGDINLAYLVKSNYRVISLEELGKSEKMSTGQVLHDRVPLLLTVELPDGKTQLQVLNLHMRSLQEINSRDSAFVRLKRHEQAISVGKMVQSLQSKGNLVVVGDLNAYPFSDGLVDVVRQLSGQASEGALFSPVPTVTPALRNLSNELPEPIERYSYIFEGNRQILDHCLINEWKGLVPIDLEYARCNTGFPVQFREQDTTVLRLSDHDGWVLTYQYANSPVQNPNPASLTANFPNPLSSGSSIRFEAPAAIPNAHLSISNMQGQVVYTASQLIPGTLQWPLVLPPGVYTLFVSYPNGKWQQQVVVR